MYQTSSRYKELIYNKQHLLNIYIDEIKIEQKYIIDFKISHFLFSDDEFRLGSTPAKLIEFKIDKRALPQTYNNIRVETGIRIRNSVFSVAQINSKKVKELTTSPVYMFHKHYEIIPIGKFTLEEIDKEDDYTVTIKAIDYMVKFEFNYDGSTLTYPCTLKSILQDICTKAGVELRFYFFFEYG